MRHRQRGICNGQLGTAPHLELRLPVSLSHSLALPSFIIPLVRHVLLLCR